MLSILALFSLPSWLTSSLSSFGSFVVGAICKMIWDAILAKRANKIGRIDRVERFKGSLKELSQLDLVQKKFISKLVKLIEIRRNITTPTLEDKYESLIADNYPTFTDSELDLFITIRGMTVNSMKRLTDDLSTWIDQNTEFKNNTIKNIQTGPGFDFSQNIVKLELHLNVWKDKYAAWMSNDKHAFIRIDDEESVLKLLTEIKDDADAVIEALESDKRLLLAKNQHQP